MIRAFLLLIAFLSFTSNGASVKKSAAVSLMLLYSLQVFLILGIAIANYVTCIIVCYYFLH